MSVCNCTPCAKTMLMKACLSYKILLAKIRTAATTSCLASIWMTDRSLTTPCFSNCGLLLGVHVVARPIRAQRSWPSAVGVSLQGKREQPQKKKKKKHMNDWEIVMSSQWGRSTDPANHSVFLFCRTVTKSLLLPGWGGSVCHWLKVLESQRLIGWIITRRC